MDKPVCEVCGATAVSAVWDLFLNENWDTGMKEYSHNGGAHFRCDKHKRESETTNITESPLTHFYNKLQE